MSRSCKTEEVEHWATITQRGRVGTESHGDLLLHVQPAANEFAGRPRAHTQASGRHTRSSRTCGRETDPFVPPHDLPVRCENPLCRRQAVGSGPPCHCLVVPAGCDACEGRETLWNSGTQTKCSTCPSPASWTGTPPPRWRRTWITFMTGWRTAALNPR